MKPTNLGVGVSSDWISSWKLLRPWVSANWAQYDFHIGSIHTGCLKLKCPKVNGSTRTYLQLLLLQWGAGNVYLLVLSSWKINIAENPIAVMGL